MKNEGHGARWKIRKYIDKWVSPGYAYNPQPLVIRLRPKTNALPLRQSPEKDLRAGTKFLMYTYSTPHVFREGDTGRNTHEVAWFGGKLSFLWKT